ncbi:hypothetical protein ACFY5D_07430 [Paeniglutamicibacter sp. NPDC012692]|uniref:hypothetical protein n=1 Tax=Paeniglutamicibacter sp. NPDC012692 TaxID=3364388 RepID=UPI0036C65AAB
MSVPPPPEGKAALPARRARPQKRAWWHSSLLWALVGTLGILLIFLYGTKKILGEGDGKGAAALVTRNPSPGLDGIIALQVPPEQLAVGDCLQGFKSALEPVTIVTCVTAHNAQMIGSFEITEVNFPGPEQMLSRSESLCKSVTLDPGSSIDSTWSYHFSRPSAGTWKTGDRKVACFLTLNEGTVQDSLLPSDAAGISS